MVLLTFQSTPTEGVRLEQDNIEVNVDGVSLPDKGTLFITESCVSWQIADGKGFTLYYPDIGLHAISRDVSAFPRECLFCMFEGKLPEEVTVRPMDDTSEEEEEEAIDDTPPMQEIRFIPEDKTQLETMYNHMCDCQALHPDPQDTDSDVEAESDAMYYHGEEGMDNLTAEGQATLAHLEHLLITGSGDAPPPALPNGNQGPLEGGAQFEDADEADMEDQG